MLSPHVRACISDRPNIFGLHLREASSKCRGSVKSSAHLFLKGRKSYARGNVTRIVLASAGASPNLKNVLYKELEKVSPNGLTATPDDQRKIAEMVTAVERENPTSAPAHSPLMAGFWRMLYTDMEPAPSSGKLGPFVGEVYQDLRPTDGLIVNLLKVNSILQQTFWNSRHFLVPKSLFFIHFLVLSS